MTDFIAVVAPARDRLKVGELLFFLIEYHLKGKASQRPFRSNAKALSKSLGDVFWDSLTEPDVLSHIAARKAGVLTGRTASPQTIKHDIKLLSMAWHVARRWKKNRWTVGDYDFGPLQMPVDNPVEEIARPKTKPRKREVDPMAFARWIEQAPERLANRTFFALDTGLNPIELERLRTTDYDSRRDGFYIQRGKSGEVGFLPATKRCREIVIKAIAAGREFILDFKNAQRDIEENRRKTGVYFWFGRDLRCTFYNEVLRRTDHDYKAAQRAMLHADPRTGPEHYETDEATDLRRPIQEIEMAFSVGEKII